ncbi:ATP-binding protein [Streptomyces sp. S3(2020)]|uniref:ATP-binding protein n=1 Tax=Streptomyces sp. S3(2020) TaxID=2732044 RepID=UPI001487F2B1|nr:ATP-binding protein [Streptomyces sp. S3(2020)]NNN37701.1 ATP-binding protein [Streptomyces sp. S3(2020)]
MVRSDPTKIRTAEELHEQLRALFVEGSWSIHRLAAAAELGSATVQAILDGTTRVPQARTLQRFVKACGRNPAPWCDARARVMRAEKAPEQGSTPAVDREFQSYFDPHKAAGSGGRGRYFTGRLRALAELTRWLDGDSPMSYVVTGGPGSGKSTLLARLLALPSRERIHIAVHARGKTSEQIARQISEAAGLGCTPEELPAALCGLERPVTIMIDAIDEAPDRDRLVLDLVHPLIDPSGPRELRLLLGTRRDLVHLLTGCHRLDLDDPDYFDQADISAFVTATLRQTEPVPGLTNPYFGHPGDVPERVGAAVSRSAGTSFLIGRLIAGDLISRDSVVDIDAAGWDGFPSRVGDAMRLYLDSAGRRLPGGARWLRDLLTPLAYAEGDGLDDDLWADLATRLGTATYRATDLRLLRDMGAGDLVSYTGSGWRLFHQALAVHLRDDLARIGLDSARAHRAITEVLVASVPTDEHGIAWWRAPHYARAHVAGHAAQAGVLDPFLADAMFLLAAERSWLAPHLHQARSSAARAAVECYQLIQHVLDPTQEQQAADCLRTIAGLRGAHEVVGQVNRRHPEGWEIAWSTWSPESAHRTLPHTAAPVSALAVGRLQGREIVVTVARTHDDYLSTVRTWDLVTGQEVGPAFTVPLEVRSVTVARTQGRVVAVIAGARPIPAYEWRSLEEGTDDALEGQVGCWDPMTGGEIGRRRVYGRPVNAVAAGMHQGHSVVVVGTGPNDELDRMYDDGESDIWDIDDGAEPTLRSSEISVWDLDDEVELRNHEVMSPVRAVAIGQADGQTIVVAGTTDLVGVMSLR